MRLNRLTILAMLWLAACQTAVVPEPPELEPEPPPMACQEVVTFRQDGVASWYGPNHHGKKTASGVPFDMNAMTAAHRRLPLGTRVKVTNLANGRQTELLINDRGPYIRGRILDASRRAAQVLGFESRGTTQVRIETAAITCDTPAPPANTNARR